MSVLFITARGAEDSMPLYKMRVYAYLCIPADASVESARSWLNLQAPNLSPSVSAAICKVHGEDLILAEWRAGGV